MTHKKSKHHSDSVSHAHESAHDADHAHAKHDASHQVYDDLEPTPHAHASGTRHASESKRVTKIERTRKKRTNTWKIATFTLAILLLLSVMTSGFADLGKLLTGISLGTGGSNVEYDAQGAYVFGSPDAPVTIIEYSSYQCPFCARFHSDSYPQIVRNYVEEGLVQYVYRDFPLSGQLNSKPAAHAARCAGEQDAYLEMQSQLFSNQAQWASLGNPTDQFVTYAERIGITAQTFRTCQTSGKYNDAIDEDFQSGVNAGVTGTPSFLINGQRVVGAQPYAVFEQAIEAALSGQAPPPPTQPEAPAPAARVQLALEGAGIQGSETAEVYLIEFSSYQCPFCARFQSDTYPQVFQNYIDTGIVQYIYRDFPLSGQVNSQPAAHAARCAGEQDAYFEMKAQLFNNQAQWASLGNPTAQFVTYAERIGLDADEFLACHESGRYDAAIAADFQTGVSVGVTGTPSFFIGTPENGFVKLVGAQPYSVFAQAFEAER